MAEKYWVGSSGESEAPEKLYFSEKEAMRSDHNYLDSFDEEGNFVKGYKNLEGTYFAIE